MSERLVELVESAYKYQLQIIIIKMENFESNILVAVRIRPLTQKEQQSTPDLTRVEDNLIVSVIKQIVYDPVDLHFENENKINMDVLHRSKEQRYAFDKIFKNAVNEQIYRLRSKVSETCQALVEPVMSGFNGTVFAYGPTGTGKTYTMLGDKEKNVNGLSVLIIQDILAKMEQDQEHRYSLLVSYVEIYNENIR